MLPKVLDRFEKSAILDWAKKKGLAEFGDAIVKKIAREGYDPRWVVKRSLEIVKPRIPKFVAQAMKRINPNGGSK